MKTKLPFRIHRSLQILSATAALVLGSLSADAAGYIKFDGVDGESTEKSHKNWCNLEAMSMGVRRAGGSAAAKVEFKEFTVTKKTDRSSPKLMEAVCLGRVFPKVQLHLTEEGADGEQIYYIIELENVVVTSFSMGGSAGSAPADEFSMNYEKIKAIHVDRDGSQGGNVEFEWHIEEAE